MSLDGEDVVISVVGWFESVVSFDRNLVEIDRIPTDGENMCIRSNADVTIVSGQDKPNAITCFNNENGSKMMEILTGHADFIGAIAMTENVCLSAGFGDRTTKLWEFATGRKIGECTGDGPQYVLSIHADESSKHVLVGGQDPADIVEYDVETMTRIGVYSGHYCCVGGLLTSDALLFSCSYDHTLRIWDAKGAKTQIQVIHLSHSGKCIELMGNEVFVGLPDGHVDVLDRRKFESGVVDSFKIHSAGVNQIQFLDEDDLVSVSSDERVVLFRNDGKVLWETFALGGKGCGVSVHHADVSSSGRVVDDEGERALYMLASSLPLLTGSLVVVECGDGTGGTTRLKTISRLFWEECLT